MNKIKILMAMLALVVFVSSCEDPERLPLVVLGTVEKGAYPRLIDDTDKLINLFNVSGSSYTYNIEFVDIEGGALVEEYVLDLVFDDNNSSNGDKSGGPFEFIKLDASQFVAGENGYLKAPTITITGPEALAAAGLTEADVLAGDNFNFAGRITMSDGRVFSQNNSSATVVGPAFRGHFNFTMPAACPSNLEGTYGMVNTATWCGLLADNGTVDILANGGGVYTLSDWSLGAYPACYGGNAAGWGTLSFTDVCAEVSFSGFSDNYGDTWSLESVIEGNDWVITWGNTTYAPEEGGGTSRITFPDGVPFTLVE